MVKIKNLEEKVSEIITIYKDFPWIKIDIKIEKCEPSSHFLYYSHSLKSDIYDYGIIISISQLCDYVKLTFAMSNELAKLFGTEHLRIRSIDDFCVDGCKVCNFGCIFISKILIRGHTINIEEFQK